MKNIIIYDLGSEVIYNGNHTDLTEAVEYCIENNISLENADLRRANFKNASLRGADLQESDLRGANLYGADLTDANLMGADLIGADLRGAILTNAILDSVYISWCTGNGKEIETIELGDSMIVICYQTQELAINDKQLPVHDWS